MNTQQERTISRKYHVLYADCPWKYENINTGGSMKSGAAAQYPTMSVDELCAMRSQIDAICTRDSVLFLWATAPLLPAGFQVLSAWGYTYKTVITWKKTGRLGLGFWFRGQCEFLLFGVRGRVKAFRSSLPNVIEATPTKHSRKPEEARRLIETATSTIPDVRYLELFAREYTPGWDVWGNEIHADIDLLNVTERSLL